MRTVGHDIGGYPYQEDSAMDGCRNTLYWNTTYRTCCVAGAKASAEAKKKRTVAIESFMVQKICFQL